MLKEIDNYIICFISLIPFALITGPFIPDLLVVLINILVIYQIVKKKYYNYFNNIFFYLFFIYCFYLILSSLISKNIFLSLESSLFYFRFGVFALAIWYILDNNKSFLKIFKISLLSVFLLLFFDASYQYITDYNLIGYHYGGNRLSSFFGDEKKLGNFLVRLLPILLAIIIINDDNYKNKIIFLFFFLFSGFVILISGDRTALLFYLILILGFILLINEWFKIKLLLVVLASFFILFATLSDKNIYNRIISNTLIMLTATPDDSKIDLNNPWYLFSKDHHIYILTSYRMFKNNLITGIGPKNYRVECEDVKYETLNSQLRNINRCNTHPHNTYMQILAETGIIGIIPVLGVFLLIMHQIIIQFLNKLKGSEYISNFKILLYLALMVSLFPVFPSFSFFNNWISIIYYLPIGFILSKLYQKS